jgi:hypothetical protein
MKHRVALTLTDPYTTIVSLTFHKLKHLCRFEKGGYFYQAKLIVLRDLWLEKKGSPTTLE